MSRSRVALISAVTAAVVVAGGIGLAAVISGRESEPRTTSSVAAESPMPTPSPTGTATPHQKPHSPRASLQFDKGFLHDIFTG